MSKSNNRMPCQTPESGGGYHRTETYGKNTSNRKKSLDTPVCDFQGIAWCREQWTLTTCAKIYDLNEDTYNTAQGIGFIFSDIKSEFLFKVLVEPKSLMHSICRLGVYFAVLSVQSLVIWNGLFSLLRGRSTDEIKFRVMMFGLVCGLR